MEADSEKLEKRFFEILEEFGKNIDKSEEDSSLQIEGSSQYDSLIKSLTKLGFSFTVRTSTTLKGEPRFQFTQKTMPIKFFGSPFINKFYKFHTCAHGPTKHVKTMEKNKHKSTRMKRGTKKYNCKAIMIVQKIAYFPQYVLDESKYGNWRHRSEVLRQLREALTSNTNIPLSERYFLKISLPNVHNHFITKYLPKKPSVQSDKDFPVVTVLKPVYIRNCVIRHVIKKKPTTDNKVTSKEDMSETTDSVPTGVAAQTDELCKLLSEETRNWKPNCDESVVEQCNELVRNALQFMRDHLSGQNSKDGTLWGKRQAEDQTELKD